MPSAKALLLPHEALLSYSILSAVEILYVLSVSAIMSSLEERFLSVVSLKTGTGGSCTFLLDFIVKLHCAMKQSRCYTIR